MPRHKSAVKDKHVKTTASRSRPPASQVSAGLVDIHFHGAFGVDLMKANRSQLDELSWRLWAAGIAGFCPTTLSTTPAELLSAVETLGSWTVQARKKFYKKDPEIGAYPLGLHLEGPFINPKSAGAHPKDTIRKLNFTELETLWEASAGTLKILTIAPETLGRENLQKLSTWAKSRQIILSLGHSQASYQEAKTAFQSGFSGITHAWNALPFHHRAPGALAAAIGDPKLYLELIIDQIHVHPALVRFTCQGHQNGKICFVSDCAPAAETKGKTYTFGHLRVKNTKGASRLPDGSLAGGGRLLTRLFEDWLSWEAQDLSQPIEAVLQNALPWVTEHPLLALGYSSTFLKGRSVAWVSKRPARISALPIYA